MIKCTYCGGEGFYEGPEGPGAQNILCANPACRHWFNNTITGLHDLNKVEPTEDERKAMLAAEEKKKYDEVQGLLDEGKAIYEEGKPLAEACVDYIYNRHTGIYTKDTLRIAGWLQAQAGSVRSSGYPLKFG